MTDTDNNDAKKRRIAEAVHPILEDGDEFHIERDDGSTEVKGEGEFSTPSALRESNPELYGHLSRVSSSIDNAIGCSALLILPLGLMAGLFGVEIWGNYHEGVQVIAEEIHFWSYIIALIFGSMLSAKIKGFLERRAFAREREELVEAIRSARISLDALIAVTAGDTELDDVRDALKTDRKLRDRLE